MKSLKLFCKQLTEANWFEWIITIIIIINSGLIGIETYANCDVIDIIQKVILGIFTIEILARFIAADSVKEFFKSGWNIFDLSLVLIVYIPETVVANTSMYMALRILRVFRVLRLLRAAKEMSAFQYSSFRIPISS